MAKCKLEWCPHDTDRTLKSPSGHNGSMHECKKLFLCDNHQASNEEYCCDLCQFVDENKKSNEEYTRERGFMADDIKIMSEKEKFRDLMARAKAMREELDRSINQKVEVSSKDITDRFLSCEEFVKEAETVEEIFSAMRQSIKEDGPLAFDMIRTPFQDIPLRTGPYHDVAEAIKHAKELILEDMDVCKEMIKKHGKVIIDKRVKKSRDML